MLPTKFRFICPSGYRGEDFRKSTNQKKLPAVAMFVNESGRYEQFLLRTFHKCSLPSFGSFGHAVSEENIILIDQSETRIARGGYVC